MDLNLYVNSIKDHFKVKFIEIHLKNEFGSVNKNYREKIRQNIVDNCSSLLSTWEKKSILNLALIPSAENLFFSISHAKSIGGYLAAGQKSGFDIEELGRISDDVIKRTCANEEVSTCPNIKFLWGAKESAFKTIFNLKTISDVKISNWTEVSPELFSFSANNGSRGLLAQLKIDQAEYIISFCTA
ncbi:MAG: hypothetical protein H7Z71_00345 [Moraxellaceae bacterium]|nr:hypothetical protein [Pseudobdellovibrionaceae bacterium]